MCTRISNPLLCWLLEEREDELPELPVCKTCGGRSCKGMPSTDEMLTPTSTAAKRATSAKKCLERRCGANDENKEGIFAQHYNDSTCTRSPQQLWGANDFAM